MNRRSFLLSSLAAIPASAARMPSADILGAALSDEQGWQRLEHLCYQIGNRLSGSDSLQQTVEWAAALMRQDGQDNVRLQPVKVPHWVRGAESCLELSPGSRELRILGLGMTVGTPPEGIEAEVAVVRDFDELEVLGRAGVASKIVLYDAPYTAYDATVRYRTGGASRAAQLGALAALVRSVTPASLSTPHTGAMSYAADAPKIPAAAVTVEDSLRLAGLARLGIPIRVRLMMGAKMLPDADSANVLGEIRGREKPEEIVVMGGHIDSWDVGQGAHDDGAACMAALQALALIRNLGLQPRRTLRVALWTNEENGAGGARAYRDALGTDVQRHVAAIEMDGGCERPAGFGLGLPADDPRSDRALAQARQIASALRGIGADEIALGGGGADIGPLMREGVPGFGLRTDGGRYFHWHHSDADTLDKVNPMDFRRAIATLGVFGYGLADLPVRLGEES